MLQWNPRLISTLMLVALIATALLNGLGAGDGGLNFNW